MTRHAAALLLVLAMSLTGANVPLGKAIIAELPIAVFLLLRFLIATATLALLAVGEPGPRLSTLRPEHVPDLLGLSLVGSVAFMALSLEGLKRTSGVDAGIILATLPAVAAVGGILLRRERPDLLQGTAILAAVAGLVIVNTAAATGGPTGSAIGNLLAGAAVLCEATFVLVSGRISAIYRPIRLALAVSAVSLVLCLPLCLPALSVTSLAGIAPSTWLWVIWYALAASVFCPILWYRGAPYVETWLAGLSTASLPVVALALSALFLGETIDLARLAGAALVIGAIVLGALAPARPPA